MRGREEGGGGGCGSSVVLQLWFSLTGFFLRRRHSDNPVPRLSKGGGCLRAAWHGRGRRSYGRGCGRVPESDVLARPGTCAYVPGIRARSRPVLSGEENWKRKEKRREHPPPLPSAIQQQQLRLACSLFRLLPRMIFSEGGRERLFLPRRIRGSGAEPMERCNVTFPGRHKQDVSSLTPLGERPKMGKKME